MLPWIGDFLYHISPELIAVLIAGFWIQSFWTKRANESAWIDTFHDEMNTLVDEALEYWSLDYSDGAANADANRTRAQMLEPRIRGGIFRLNSQLRRYAERYRGRSFNALMVELNDACTGGGFESHIRGPQRSRYIPVVNSTLKIRWQLFERQNEMPVAGFFRRRLSDCGKPFTWLRRWATDRT